MDPGFLVIVVGELIKKKVHKYRHEQLSRLESLKKAWTKTKDRQQLTIIANKELKIIFGKDIFVACQLIYVRNRFIFQENITSTFYWNCYIVGSKITP